MYYLVYLILLTGSVIAAEPNAKLTTALTPSPPLQLTQTLPVEISEENLSQIIENPDRLEEAMKYNQKIAQSKAFPWLELSLLLLLGLFGFVVKYAPPALPKRELTPIMKLKKARNIALQAIASVQQEHLDSQQQSQALSHIVRQFIEEAYQVHAPKQTTEEFLKIAASNPHFNLETTTQLKAFLLTTDKIKFSHFLPKEGEMNELSKTAQSFIR